MPTSFLRRLLIPGCLLAAGLFFLPSRLAADLLWNPESGWQMENGTLSGLNRTESATALGMMNQAHRTGDKGSKGAAAKGYEKVAKKFPTSVYAPEAYYQAGLLRLSRRQYFKSFTDFQRILSTYPNTPRFNELIGIEYRIASKLLNGARNRLWGWMPGFVNRSRAISYFETILSNAPYSDYAPLSLMSAARGYEYAGDTEESIDAMDRIVNVYQQSVLAPNAYLRLGQLHSSISQGPSYDQGSTRDAITYFEDFMILYPNDPNIGQAARGLDRMKTMLAQSKVTIGDFYFYKRDNFAAARILYNEAITSYPDSEVAKLAKRRLAEVDAKASGRPVRIRRRRFWLF